MPEKYFIPKPFITKMIQWDGSNVSEIQNFVSQYDTPYWGNWVATDNLDGTVTIVLGSNLDTRVYVTGTWLESPTLPSSPAQMAESRQEVGTGVRGDVSYVVDEV